MREIDKLTEEEYTKRTDEGRDFHARHGYLPVLFGAVYLYPDGARRHSLDGEFMEPPEDAENRTALVCAYYETRAGIALHEFREFLRLTQDTNGEGVDPDEWQKTSEFLERQLAYCRKLSREAFEARGPAIRLIRLKDFLAKRYPDLSGSLANPVLPEELAAAQS